MNRSLTTRSRPPALGLNEAKIGRELEAAQARGEVESHGGDRKSIKAQTADFDRASLSDIGIPKQRASEMKALAKLGDAEIEREVKTATSEGRRVSRRQVVDAVDGRPA